MKVWNPAMTIHDQINARWHDAMADAVGIGEVLDEDPLLHRSFNFSGRPATLVKRLAEGGVGSIYIARGDHNGETYVVKKILAQVRWRPGNGGVGAHTESLLH